MFSTTCIQRHNHDNSGFIKRHQIVHYQGHHILYQHQVTWNIFNNVGFSNTCKSTHKLCWKFSMVQWVVMGSAMGSLGLAHAPCVVQTLVVWFSMIWCVAHCKVLRRQIFKVYKRVLECFSRVECFRNAGLHSGGEVKCTFLRLNWLVGFRVGQGIASYCDPRRLRLSVHSLYEVQTHKNISPVDFMKCFGFQPHWISPIQA